MRRDAESAAQEHARAAIRAATDAQIGALTRDIAQADPGTQREGDLLAALATATPPAITLSQVTCEEGQFSIRGRVYDGSGSSEDALARFRAALCAGDARWRVADPSESAGPRDRRSDFSWQGSLLPDPPPAGDPAALESRLTAARSRLPDPESFGRWIAEWSPRWKIVAGSAGVADGLAIRRRTLAYDHPGLGSWSDIVDTIRKVCRQPGVSVDSLVLTAAPDGADRFAEARISLTARLRPKPPTPISR